MPPPGSTEVVERPGAPGEARRRSGDARALPAGPWAAWARAHGLSLLLAAAILYLALKGGAYGLSIRGPLAMIVWGAIALGVAVGFLPRERPAREAFVLAGLLAAFTALQGLSAAWGDSSENALLEFDRVALYLGVFLLVVMAASRGSARRWSDGLALGLTAVGLLALSHRLFPDVFNPSDIERLNPGDPRLSYPVNYWNGLSALVALGLPLLMRIATDARSRVGAGLALAPIPALAATMYLTSSRGGAVAGAVGLGAFVLLTSRRVPALAGVAIATLGSAVAIALLRTQDELVGGPLDADVVPSQGRTAAILIVLACVATAVAYAFARSRVPERVHVSRTAKRVAAVTALFVLVGGIVAANPAQRFEDLKEPPEVFNADYVQSHIVSTSGNGRWQFWSAAVDQFEDNPVLGGGAGSYEAWWAQHGTLDYFTRNAHSLFLETLGELGLVGLLLLVALFGTAVVLAIRRTRATAPGDRAAVAALAASFLAFVLAVGTDWAWDLTVIGVIGVACLALILGPAAAFPARPPERRPWLAQARRGLAWRIPAVVLALALAVTAGIPWQTERKVRESERELRAGELEQALAAARDARGIQPWAASPHLQLAVVYEYQRDYEAAHASIQRAIDRDPSDWQLWIVASRIDEALGDLDSAREDFDHAHSLNPRSAYFDKAKRPGDEG